MSVFSLSQFAIHSPCQGASPLKPYPTIAAMYLSEIGFVGFSTVTWSRVLVLCVYGCIRLQG